MKQRLVDDAAAPEVALIEPGAQLVKCLACGSVSSRDECPTCAMRIELGRLRALVASYQKTVNNLEFRAGS